MCRFQITEKLQISQPSNIIYNKFTSHKIVCCKLFQTCALTILKNREKLLLLNLIRSIVNVGVAC